MSRAKSPRASGRLIGFDSSKIRNFGTACRLSRQYYNGGSPKPGIDKAEDDPDYNESWNLILQKCSTETGVPISTISEIENHSSYRLGLDNAMSLAVFLWLNSKNGYLLDEWILPENLLCLDEIRVNHNVDSGFKPVSLDLITSKRQNKSTMPVADSRNDDFLLSKEFILAVEFLLSDWARLTESSVNSAIKASKMPLDEFERLKAMVARSDKRS